MPLEIPLSRVATIIRSKNAGPFRITLDIVFRDSDTYRRVIASRVIAVVVICGLIERHRHSRARVAQIDHATFAIEINNVVSVAVATEREE